MTARTIALAAVILAGLAAGSAEAQDRTPCDQAHTFDGDYPAGESSRRIAADIVAGMGLELGPLNAIPDDAVFPIPFYWGGHPAKGALMALLRPLGLQFEVQCDEGGGVVTFSEADIPLPIRPPLRRASRPPTPASKPSASSAR